MAAQAEYKSKTVDNLLYHVSPKIIDSIAERKVIRAKPRGKYSGYGAAEPMEFEISNDQFIDLPSVVLHFELNSTNSNGGNDQIANAADFCDQMSVYYNEVTVEQVRDTNAWMNAFLSYSANRTYMQGEATTLLGVRNQIVQTVGNSTVTDGTSPGFKYSVPLALLSGFFRCKFFLPILGNRLRFRMVLPNNVVDMLTSVSADNTGAITGASYTLNNISITYDMLVIQPAYRSAVIEAMKSEQGFRIPFTSYQTGQLGCAAATSQYLKISHDLSNAMSLFLLHNPLRPTLAVPVPITGGTWAAGRYALNRESFPLNSFTSLRVMSGSLLFTPNEDIQGAVELYVSTQKCVASLSDLSGAGWVSSDILKASGDLPVYGTGVPSTRPPDYGITLMGVNLEKTVETDEAVNNNGLTSRSGGATSDFDIVLTTGNALRTDSNILYNIVHKRNVVFQGGNVNVQF